MAIAELKKQFLDLWIETLQMMREMGNEIHEIIDMCDVVAKKLEKKTESEFINEIQPWFRVVIRSVMSVIEGTCFKLKEATLLICTVRRKKLSPRDLIKLKEKIRDKNGRIKNYYLKTEDNIRFTLKKFYYAFDLDFEVKDSKEWEKVRTTIQVRNRLTHPKKLIDLKVSIDEYSNAASAFQWFEQQMSPFND